MRAESLTYRDKWIRVTAVPFFTAIGYYVTYNNIQFNGEFILLFISDLIKGFAVWEVVRMCTVLLDKKYPWKASVLKRLLLQLTFPVASGILLFILLVQLEYHYVRSFPLENFYTLDIWIVLVFLLCSSLIYTSLYFYQRYADLQKEPLTAPPHKDDGLMVRYGNKESKIGFKDIVAFYSEGKQTWLLTKELRRLPVDQSLDRLEQFVPSYFFRVSRQYLLTPSTVTSISLDTYGKVKAETEKRYNLDPVIIVSREKAAGFKKWFRNHTSSV